MIEHHSLLLLFAIGSATGIVTGLTGAGMSVFISSLLLLGTPIREVIGLSFAVTLANAATAAIPFATKGHIPLWPATVMSLSVALMVFPGYYISHTFSNDILNRCMIIGLCFIGIRLVFFPQPAATHSGKGSTRFHALYLVLPGIIAGGIMGIIGGGGALLMSLMLILIFKLPIHKALGITFVAMAAGSLPGLYLYGKDGFVSLPPMLSLIISSTVCAYAAARVANRLSELQIKRFLGAYLLLISLFLIIRESARFF